MRKGECIHHINEIKTDNRICNLFACSRMEHNKAHKMGRISKVKASPHWKSKKCINCGEVFYGPPQMIKYRLRCSGSCKPKRLMKECSACEKVYTVPQHAAHIEHCSRKCRQILNRR